MSTQYQDQDYELLSAYIDGTLSNSERVALERRLVSDLALQAELASLRQTVALIKQLPPRHAPRDFTLPASTSRRTLPFPLTPVFSALSTAAAMLLFIFGGYFLLRSNATTLQLQQGALEAPAAQIQVPEVAMDNLAAAPTATLPQVSNRIQATPSPMPTQASPTPLPTNTPRILIFTAVPTHTPPSAAEESRDSQADSNLALQAPPADQDGEDQSESLGFAASAVADYADDGASLFRAETATALPTETATLTATDLALPEQSAGASANEPGAEGIITFPATAAPDAADAGDSANEPETEAITTSLATPTAEAVVLDEPESDTPDHFSQQGQDQPGESALRQRLQTSPVSPFVGLILLALGALFTLTAVATTLLRRRQRR